MPKKLTTNEFITKAKQVHGDKFIYNKVDYINAITKVIITCRLHGEFWQKPGNHLFGACCIKCRQEQTGKANAMSQEEFISKGVTLHGQRYDYSKVIYVGCLVPVEVICKIHGSFFQKPNIHLTNHHCPKCSRDSAANFHRKTLDKFIKDATSIHRDLYDYSLVEYKGSHNYINIICKVHGIFNQKPNAHLNGHGCPVCKCSKGELEIRYILNNLGIEYIYEKTFPNCKNKYRLSYDFYFIHNGTEFLIEYDGQHHFYGWDEKQSSLKYIQHNDAIKTQFALDNGLTLIRIPYTEFGNIETIIKSAIS